MSTFINTLIVLLLILYFIEWAYVIYSCERKVYALKTNTSIWIELDACFSSHSSIPRSIDTVRIRPFTVTLRTVLRP
jgi:hypothetical protein